MIIRGTMYSSATGKAKRYRLSSEDGTQSLCYYICHSVKRSVHLNDSSFPLKKRSVCQAVV